MPSMETKAIKLISSWDSVNNLKQDVFISLAANLKECIYSVGLIVFKNKLKSSGKKPPILPFSILTKLEI